MTISEDVQAELARRVRERRDELILSQVEAAEQLLVSERTLQAWERGEQFPQPKQRRRLMAWLGGEAAA